MPASAARPERRLSGGAGLLFKGSGFYITDYRSDSYKKAADSESATAGGKGEARLEVGRQVGEQAGREPSASKAGRKLRRPKSE